MKNGDTLKRDLFLLYIAGFCGYASSSMVFPIIAPYSIELGANNTVAGIISGGFALVTFLTMVPLGIVADRVGRFKVTLFGMVFFIVAPVLYILSTNYIQLLLARFVHGFGIALFVPALNAIVIDLSPETRKGEALGWIATFTMLGYSAGPLLGGVTADVYGTISVFYFSILVSVIAILLLSPVKYRGVRAERFRMVELNRKVFGAMSTPFLATVGSSAIAIYTIPLYLPEFNIDTSFVGLLVFALFFISAVVRVPAGILSDVVGRFPVILIGLTVQFVGILMFFLNDVPFFVFGTILSGMGMGLANPAGFALISDMVPPDQRGFAMGISSASLQLGVFTGPTVMGLLVDLYSFSFAFLAMATIILLSSIGLIFLIGRSIFDRRG